MMRLFGEKGANMPEEQLTAFQAEQDWKGLAIAYYNMGTAAMDQGDLYRAVLWLNRADNIYSARDEIYEAVGDEIVADCSDRIGTLEDKEELLYNSLPSQVDDEAEEKLGDGQIRVWALLSMARLVRLGERLGTLPGCEVLGRLGRSVDLLLKSFREPITKGEFQELSAMRDQLGELADEPALWSGNEIEVSGGAPFQAFDLNGMLLLLELSSFIDSQLQMLLGNSGPAERELISAAVLLDYYVRTAAGDPAEVPQVKAELARIWDDYAFVRSGVTWVQVAQRVEAYKGLDLLA